MKFAVAIVAFACALLSAAAPIVDDIGVERRTVVAITRDPDTPRPTGVTLEEAIKDDRAVGFPRIGIPRLPHIGRDVDVDRRHVVHADASRTTSDDLVKETQSALNRVHKIGIPEPPLAVERGEPEAVEESQTESG